MIKSKVYTESYLKIANSVPNLKELRNKSVFITGATGLIGSAITDFLIVLNEKYHYNMKIFAGSRNYNKFKALYYDNLETMDLIYVSYDIFRPIVINEQIDFIIHAASISQPEHYVSKSKETLLGGIRSIENLIEFVKSSGYHSKIAFISSSEVYGKIQGDVSITEDLISSIDINNLRSSYALSKMCSELLLKNELNKGLKYSICRPGHIYGPLLNPDDTRAYAEFIRKAIEGKPIVLKSTGEDIRSYIFIYDCVSAIMAILLNGNTGDIFNISDHHSNYKIKEFASMISKEFNVSLDFDVSSSKNIHFNPMKNATLDSTKLLLLGWESKYNLKDAIELIRLISLDRGDLN
jgi:nucleoside-diphosphate-sugar epimerase